MLWRRLKASVQADVHGMIDAIEDRALLLRQHLREAEAALQDKRARAAELVAEQARLAKERVRLQEQRARHDEDAELAVAAGHDELARHAIARVLSADDLDRRLAQRLEDNADERRTLQELLVERECALAELRVRAEAFFAREADAADRGAHLQQRAVAAEEIELELLRRRKATDDRGRP